MGIFLFSTPQRMYCRDQAVIADIFLICVPIVVKLPFQQKEVQVVPTMAANLMSCLSNQSLGVAMAGTFSSLTRYGGWFCKFVAEVVSDALPLQRRHFLINEPFW